MTSKFIDGWRGVEVESANESDNLNVSRLSIIDLYSESTSEQINELVRACESVGAFFVKSPYLDTDFKLNPIEETENELKLFLFLGNNYGNCASEDVVSMFKHEQMRSEDALVIGIDTPCQETLDEFYLREIEKYHDDKMRMGLFSKLGFKRENLIDIIQVNREREQVEVYSLVSKKSSLSELKIEDNDLFLANIARRPSLDNLKKELSEVFTVVILKNANSVEKQLTLAVCKLKGTQ
ncbi:L-histidine N(alpha)-methyltransferase [Vibrio sp. B172a]|uniref:L-histidine N(alpha)-methyltransferase n=1 Tax=Vibrio sp. B172a TaxID=2835790 RepID=UPI0025557D48|nr:L-histidine N(alpha)-methyltransferase [Vibrio sp. B172a]MDK9784589.1 L-histidine N(alpha)-methyltransferase [Vibrio sp. B172a]